MRYVDAVRFKAILDVAPIKLRFKREVRYAQAVGEFGVSFWEATELIAVSDRAGNKGVLLLEDSDARLYLAAYEVSRGMTNQSGKAQPIICDFCRTWQTGSRSGSVTLYKPGRDTGSISFLCCADLQCSRHVRNETSAARTSRAQLREDLTNDQRVERLKIRIKEIATILGLTAVADDIFTEDS